MKKIYLFILLFMMPSMVFAQMVSSSPSSRFGYGEMVNNQPASFRAMGGVSAGMRTNTTINPSQPAGYTGCDSLSFMFDIAAGIEWTRYHDANGTKNVPNGTLEYVNLQFPLWKQHIALSAGINPYSNVGYKFNLPGTTAYGNYNYNIAYRGEGGLSQVYGGLSFNIMDWVAVGANFYYTFGSVTNYITESFSDPTISPREIVRYLKFNTWRTRVGMQFFHTFAQKHNIVLGATFEPKLKMRGDYYMTETYSLDTIDLKNGFESPMEWGVGFSYTYDNRLTIAADYEFQNWSKAKFYNETNQLNDLKRIAVGAQYRHNPYSQHYAERMIWRVGGHVGSSYVREDGMRQFGVSLGLGFPLRTVATVLNFTIEYDRRTALKEITENVFKFTIDVSVNENWFHKRKL